MCVKIMIERDTNAGLRGGQFQYFNVIRARHAYIGNMNCVKPILAKNRRCPRSQSLIQNDALHATWSTLNRSSSTAAAA